jgi:hypothetical protein
MNIAITGHTNGLGKAIVNLVGNDKVVGFSTSTGYDITDPLSRQCIIDKSIHCDVFINNAHDGYAQTQLLYELWDRWAELDKIIINIGSNTTDGIKRHPHEYSAQKASLEKANEQLANMNKPCKVTMFRFGYIGTERILSMVNPSSFINTNDAAQFIIDSVNMTRSYRLTSMTILPK